jgi:transposase
VDVGSNAYLRTEKKQGGETRFVRNGVHINGIESFWPFVKRQLTKFNGVQANFDMHPEECGWRWGKSFDVLFWELKRLLV